MGQPEDYGVFQSMTFPIIPIIKAIQCLRERRGVINIFIYVPLVVELAQQCTISSILWPIWANYQPEPGRSSEVTVGLPLSISGAIGREVVMLVYIAAGTLRVHVSIAATANYYDLNQYDTSSF